MKLNFSILLEQLSDYIDCSQCKNFSNELNLNRPEHYIDQQVLLNNHLYIASADDLPNVLQAESASCIISVGRLPEKFFKQDFSIICVSENINVLTLFNMVQSVFDHYDAWDQRMQQCLNSNSDLQDMIDVSDVIFRNPIYFSDADYRVLAESQNNPLNIKYKYIPERCLNDLKQSENYEQMWNNGVPTFSYHEYRHLSIVVRSQGRFAVYISIMEAHNPFRDSDAPLLQHLAKYVLIHYEQNQMLNKNQYTSLDYILKQYLNRQPVSEQTIEKILASHDWKTDHSFCVCYIEMPEVDIRYNMIKSKCAQIQEIFATAAIVFEYHNNLCAIINLSLLDDSKSEEKLCSLLQSSNIKAGISRKFSNINSVRNFYLQAFYALKLGKNADPNLHYFKFNEYCLEYILKSPCQNLIPESLCPSGLLQMKEYDEIHGTQYVLTLKTYFDQKFNVTHAAKKLFIHRTTLLDRLNKINDFLDMDLKDSRTCLYLMISLIIIDY